MYHMYGKTSSPFQMVHKYCQPAASLNTEEFFDKNTSKISNKWNIESSLNVSSKGSSKTSSLKQSGI